MRTVKERAADLELVSDAITAALKAALPRMVRKEVEAQLGALADNRDDPLDHSAGGSRKSADVPPHPWPCTLPRPKS